MDMFEPRKRQNDGNPITSSAKSAQEPTLGAKEALSFKVGEFFNVIWSLRNSGKWGDVVGTTRSLSEHEQFSALRTSDKIAVLFEGTLAASRLGDKQTLAEFHHKVQHVIDGTEDKRQLEHPKICLQRILALATGELQFVPEEVAESPATYRPEISQWRKAAHVPSAITQLTHDIVELFRSSHTESGVVIYRDQVVPFLEAGVEKTVYYAPGCPEAVMMMSSTKSVGGLVAFMMVEDGLLKLDRKVADLMPEWNWQDDGRKEIEVRHLLTHTSGLPGNRHFAKPETTEKPFHGRWDDFTAGGILHRQVASIGTFDYSNVGAQLVAPILSRVLERSSQSSLVEYIQKRILVPLGMSRSNMTFDQVGTVKLFADMLSTCLDFARIGVMIKNRGVWNGKQVIQPTTIDTMLSTPKDLPEASKYGCGHLWWRCGNGFMNMTLGYLDTSMFIVPKLDLVVVRTQEYAPSHDIGNKLIEMLKDFYNSERKAGRIPSRE